ncbi:hypothetical protein [Solibacillus sp. FSL H8-0538]|uniref:hypothetical protein n=1 Tax=Solibacillus sp. FSL H8-0538 TaxID=2921400 RepID=UPI0030F70E2C
MENKKGIVIASIMLCYCVISVSYTLLLDGTINWSPFFLAICMVGVIGIAKSNNRLLKKLE